MVNFIFSDKSTNSEEMSFTEQDRGNTNDSKIAEILNDYFSNIVPDLGLKIADVLIHQSTRNKDCILNAISKYQNHPSIKTVLKHCINCFSPNLQP